MATDERTLREWLGRQHDSVVAWLANYVQYKKSGSSWPSRAIAVQAVLDGIAALPPDDERKGVADRMMTVEQEDARKRAYWG